MNTACRAIRRTVLVLALTACAVAAAGCGYTHGQRYDESIATVAVPIFENRVFYKGVEFDLTEALAKEIELRTPYKVLQDQSRADTALTGSIIDIDQRRLARDDRTGLVEALEVSVVVDFDWTDLRSGQVLRQRKGFTAVGHYAPARGTGEPLEVAQHQAVARLAQRIVDAMGSDW